MNIDANYSMHFKELNDLIRNSEKTIVIDNCCGQRYIAAGLSERDITINGTPGNALGAYLDGCQITVNGNAQDAVGDTMNDGVIVINGNVGDAPGYAMRGGSIYVRGKAGYRVGIHMKEYKEKKPVLIIGESVGSFLGEYLAGGLIAVLNLSDEESCVGNFTGTGMHGGKIFLRQETKPQLPSHVTVEVATDEDLSELDEHLKNYCDKFNLDKQEILSKRFYVVRPNSANPYKQLYTTN